MGAPLHYNPFLASNPSLSSAAAAAAPGVKFFAGLLCFSCTTPISLSLQAVTNVRADLA